MRPEEAHSLMRACAMLPACMGGWCQQRAFCFLHLRDDREWVEERLCPRGQETPVHVAVLAVVTV